MLLIYCALYSFGDSASSAATERIQIGGGTIHLAIERGLPVSRDAVTAWVRQAATNLIEFYGRFPVKSVDITIHASSDGAIQNGYEYDGGQIDVTLGKDTRPFDLADDWMMTHEMFHLSQPGLDDQYNWMSKGMADYLEPVARVRNGQITPERFWKDQVEGLPRGLPAAGDGGLDVTHTWGRTYWGGSLYWLLADIAVRRETKNQKSVRDAATAVLNAGGDGSQIWELDKLLDLYDRATGTDAFKTLHNELGKTPVKTDLTALCKSLGVIYDNGKVTFDDTAPLANIRRGITSHM